MMKFACEGQSLNFICSSAFASFDLSAFIRSALAFIQSWSLMAAAASLSATESTL